MKEIKAIVQESRLAEVADALQAIPAVGGITVLNVGGFGHQRGRLGVERGAGASFNFVAKSMLIVVVDDELVVPVLRVIQQRARTGNAGDGKIFVTAVEEVVRIRTGEKGASAL